MAIVPFGTRTLLEPKLMIRQVALLRAAGHEIVSPEIDDTAEVGAIVTELKSTDE